MMKKNLLTSIAYVGLSLCLCGGLIAYTGPTQEQIARIEVEDVVEGPESVIEIPEQEVPLGVPKVTTKITTKTNTKKTTMAKAATKTSKSTKKNTKKNTKTTTSSVKKVVVETTVLTTTVTSTTKKSKVKTVKTTVKTTTKTTETQFAQTPAPANNNTKPTTTPQQVTFTINSFADMNGRVNPKIYAAFNKLGFSYIYDPALTTTGVFSIKNHWIKLKVNNGYYMLHELGHFLSSLKDNADKTSEWQSIYNAEKNNFSGGNKTYVTSTPAEYFAESFRDYTTNAGQLKAERPRTYTYVNNLVTTLSDDDVEEFDDTYNIFW